MAGILVAGTLRRLTTCFGIHRSVHLGAESPDRIPELPCPEKIILSRVWRSAGESANGRNDRGCGSVDSHSKTAVAQQYLRVPENCSNHDHSRDYGRDYGHNYGHNYGRRCSSEKFLTSRATRALKSYSTLFANREQVTTATTAALRFLGPHTLGAQPARNLAKAIDL